MSAGRCSIVDYNGQVLCDIYAQPDEPITHYRTRWSGIRPRDMIRAIPVENACNIIRNIIQVIYSFLLLCNIDGFGYLKKINYTVKNI